MFSIVIPLYNKEGSIRSTIESVLSQSISDFELLVIDDGSTDSSADIVNSISDKRVHLISKTNGGVCSARNIGINKAKHEFIAFLDADDLWDPEFLSEQKKMIEDFPEAAMWGTNYAETIDEKQIRVLETALPKGFRGYVENYFESASHGRVSDLFCSSSVVIRKEAFAKAGLFDERIKYSEDLDMWFRIIANFRVAFYDRYLVFYRFDAENRAMKQKVNLTGFLPYYIGKYSTYKGNEPFYTYIHRWSAIKLKGYYFAQPAQRDYAKIAVRDLDYSVLPQKYQILFKAPFFIGYIVWWLTEAIHNRDVFRSNPALQ